MSFNYLDNLVKILIEKNMVNKVMENKNIINNLNKTTCSFNKQVNRYLKNNDNLFFKIIQFIENNPKNINLIYLSFFLQTLLRKNYIKSVKYFWILNYFYLNKKK